MPDEREIEGVSVWTENPVVWDEVVVNPIDNAGVQRVHHVPMMVDTGMCATMPNSTFEVSFQTPEQPTPENGADLSVPIGEARRYRAALVAQPASLFPLPEPTLEGVWVRQDPAAQEALNQARLRNFQENILRDFFSQRRREDNALYTVPSHEEIMEVNRMPGMGSRTLEVAGGEIGRMPLRVTHENDAHTPTLTEQSGNTWREIPQSLSQIANRTYNYMPTSAENPEYEVGQYNLWDRLPEFIRGLEFLPQCVFRMVLNISYDMESSVSLEAQQRLANNIRERTPQGMSAVSACRSVLEDFENAPELRMLCDTLFRALYRNSSITTIVDRITRLVRCNSFRSVASSYSEPQRLQTPPALSADSREIYGRIINLSFMFHRCLTRSERHFLRRAIITYRTNLTMAESHALISGPVARVSSGAVNREMITSRSQLTYEMRSGIQYLANSLRTPRTSRETIRDRYIRVTSDRDFGRFPTDWSADDPHFRVSLDIGEHTTFFNRLRNAFLIASVPMPNTAGLDRLRRCIANRPERTRRQALPPSGIVWVHPELARCELCGEFRIYGDANAQAEMIAQHRKTLLHKRKLAARRRRNVSQAS